MKAVRSILQGVNSHRVSRISGVPSYVVDMAKKNPETVSLHNLRKILKALGYNLRIHVEKTRARSRA